MQPSSRGRQERPPPSQAFLMKTCLRRLLKDQEELHRHPIPGVFAAPLESNACEWHANICGLPGTAFDGVVLHVIIRFPPSYPSLPPTVEMVTDYPHPNILRGSDLRLTVCLDMLLPAQEDSLPYRCWSSAFSASSVLTQLRSFLLQDGQPVLTNFRISLPDALAAAYSYHCRDCDHSGSKPWPPLTHPPPPTPRLISAPSIIKTLHVRAALPSTEELAPLPQPPRAMADRSRPPKPTSAGARKPPATTSHASKQAATSSPVPEAKGEEDGWTKVVAKRRPASDNGVPTKAAPSHSSSKPDDVASRQQHHHSQLRESKQPASASLHPAPENPGRPPTTGKGLTCASCKLHLPPSSFSATQLKKPTGCKRCTSCLSRPAKPPAAGNTGQPQSPTPAAAPPSSAAARPPTEKAGGGLSKAGWLELGESAGPFHSLDLNLSLCVMEFLTYADVGRLAQACKFMSAVTEDGVLWRELFSRQYPRSQLAASSMADWRRCFELEVNHLQEEMVCYFTRATHEEDVLGIPLECTRNPVKRTVDHVYSSMDILSLSAYRDHQLRRTAWGEPFTLFLPLYLTPSHFERALPHIKACLVRLASQERGGKSHRASASPPPSSFTPSMILDTLPKLLNTMAVLISDKGLAASDRALEGYCQVHRLLLALRERYRATIDKLVDDRLTAFITLPSARSKEAYPALGDLLPLISISPRYRWQDIAVPYLQESFTRNVLWSCKTFPELASLDLPDEERLAKTLQEGVISRRTTLFNSFFLRMVARPDAMTLEQVAARYDLYLGRPSLNTRLMLQRAVQRILQSSTWPDFFYLVDVTVPSPQKLANILRESVQASLDKGYHKPRMNFAKLGRRGVSRVLLRGGDKYSTPPNLKGVVMRDEWRYPNGGEIRYLDASCLVYDADGSFLAVLDYCHVRAMDGKLQHSSDVIDEASHRGQHSMTIDLAALPSKVHSLFFVLSSWKSGLRSILQPSVTLQDRDHAQAELCRYELEDKDHGDFTSILMCRLYRRQRGAKEWKVKALGLRGYGCADHYGPIEDMIAGVLSSGDQGSNTATPESSRPPTPTPPGAN